MKKILIAGDFSYYIYERAVIESLQRLGETDIQEFHFKKYYSNIFGKVEKHFVFRKFRGSLYGIYSCCSGCYWSRWSSDD